MVVVVIVMWFAVVGVSVVFVVVFAVIVAVAVVVICFGLENSDVERHYENIGRCWCCVVLWQIFPRRL